MPFYKLLRIVGAVGFEVENRQRAVRIFKEAVDNTLKQYIFRPLRRQKVAGGD